jgi:organic hydroperoxide reductase OsmC/OhrA
MEKEHRYTLGLEWTGNTGPGTTTYHSYERSYRVLVPGKPELLGSSDPAFRGDRSRYNPEELFLSALSACHMLWYLHLCADRGVIITSYSDRPEGLMTETPEGGGRFTAVTLFPQVRVTEESMIAPALELHREANRLCFIANSCNFPVSHQAEVACLPG